MEKALVVGGWTVVVLGAVLLGFGFFQDVTVTTGGYYDPYLQRSDPPSQVVNYSLMFGALRMMLAGGFLAVAGLVAVFAGEVVGRVQAPASAGLLVAAKPSSTPSGGDAEASSPAPVSETDHRAMIMVGFMVILAVIAIAAVVVGQRDAASARNDAYGAAQADPAADAAATAQAAAEDAAEAARLAAAEAADAGY